MKRKYRVIDSKKAPRSGKYGLKESFYCQKCGKETKGEGKEVINEDGNKIRVCKKCWKK